MAFDLSTDEKKKAAFDYVNNYQKEKYDWITILRKSGEKAKIDAIAKEKGLSTTQFINSSRMKTTSPGRMPSGD